MVITTINKMEESILNKIKEEHGDSLLYLKDYIHDKNKSVKDFIYEFIEYRRHNHVTLSYDESKNDTDQSLGSQSQRDDIYDCYCGKYRYRTLIDIYLITLNYYPNVSLKEVISILYYGCTVDRTISSFICDDINRRVYYHPEHPRYASFSEEYIDDEDDEYEEVIERDEFGLTKTDYIHYLN